MGFILANYMEGDGSEQVNKTGKHLESYKDQVLLRLDKLLFWLPSILFLKDLYILAGLAAK